MKYVKKKRTWPIKIRETRHMGLSLSVFGGIRANAGKSLTQRWVFVRSMQPRISAQPWLSPVLLFSTAHSSNQAGCQTNRWSQQRDISSCLLRCDGNRCNADTDAWHGVTAHCVYTAGSTLTYFEGKRKTEGGKEGRREGVWDDTVHMITHKIMFVSSNSAVTM